MAESGMSPSEISEKIEEMRSGVHTSFIVENLDFLARAGQVKSVSSTFGLLFCEKQGILQ